MRSRVGALLVGTFLFGCAGGGPVPLPTDAFIPPIDARRAADAPVGEVLNVVVVDANSPGTRLTLQVEDQLGRVITRVSGTSPFAVHVDWALGPYTFTVANQVRMVSVVDVDRNGFPGFAVTDDTLTIPIDRAPAGRAFDSSTVNTRFPLLRGYGFFGVDESFYSGVGSTQFGVYAQPGVPFRFFVQGVAGQWAAYSSPGSTMAAELPLDWSANRSPFGRFSGQLAGTAGEAVMHRVLADQPAAYGPPLGTVRGTSDGTRVSYAGEFFDQPTYELAAEFTVWQLDLGSASTVWVEGRAALGGPTQAPLPFVVPGATMLGAREEIPFTFPTNDFSIRMIVRLPRGLHPEAVDMDWEYWTVHVAPDVRTVRVPRPIDPGLLVSTRDRLTYARIRVCDPAPETSSLTCIRHSDTTSIALDF